MRLSWREVECRVLLLRGAFHGDLPAFLFLCVEVFLTTRLFCFISVEAHTNHTCDIASFGRRRGDREGHAGCIKQSSRFRNTAFRTFYDDVAEVTFFLVLFVVLSAWRCVRSNNIEDTYFLVQTFPSHVSFVDKYCCPAEKQRAAPAHTELRRRSS